MSDDTTTIAVKTFETPPVHFWLTVVGEGNDQLATLCVQEHYGVYWLTDAETQPAYRGLGYMTRLFDKAIALFGHRNLYLLAFSTSAEWSDEELIEFYRRFGFRFSGVPGVLRRSADRAGKLDFSDLIVELIADMLHRSWSGWVNGLATCCTVDEDGSWVIPADQASRWRGLAQTRSSQLPDEQRQKYRTWAQNVLDIVRSMP